MLVSFVIYVGATGFEFYPVEVSAVISMIIAFGQSRKQRADYISWALEFTDRTNWKPKPMIYPFMIAVVLIMYVAIQQSGCLMEEIDYVTDSYVLLCLGFLWVTQPAHLRTRDCYSYIVIILCVKVTFFLEKGESMNFLPDKTL